MLLARKAARYTCLLPELALRPFRSRYHQVISWAAADAGATATRPVKNAEARPTSGDKDLTVSYGVVGDWPFTTNDAVEPNVGSRGTAEGRGLILLNSCVENDPQRTSTLKQRRRER